MNMETFQKLKNMENRTILRVDAVYQGSYDISIYFDDGTKIEIYNATDIEEFKEVNL